MCNLQILKPNEKKNKYIKSLTPTTHDFGSELGSQTSGCKSFGKKIDRFSLEPSSWKKCNFQAVAKLKVKLVFQCGKQNKVGLTDREQSPVEKNWENFETIFDFASLSQKKTTLNALWWIKNCIGEFLITQIDSWISDRWLNKTVLRLLVCERTNEQRRWRFQRAFDGRGDNRNRRNYYYWPPPVLCVTVSRFLDYLASHGKKREREKKTKKINSILQIFIALKQCLNRKKG